MHTKKRVSISMGLFVALVFVYFLLQNVSWMDVFNACMHMNWLWCFPAVGSYIFGHFLRGVRCAWLIAPHKKVSFFDAMQVVWIGYAANNLLPARLGEFVRGFVMAKRENLSQATVLSSLFIERLLDGIAIVGILWGVSICTPRYAWIEEIRWISGLIFFNAVTFVLVAKLAQTTFKRFIFFASSWFPRQIGDKIQLFGFHFLEGMVGLHIDRSFLSILFLSLLVWLVEGVMFLLLLPAFGFKWSLLNALLVMAITNLGALVPSTPGHVGTFHYFCSKSLSVIGGNLGMKVAIGYAVVLHALQYVSVTLLGLWALYSYGLSLRSIWREGQEPQTKPASGLQSLPL